MDTLVGDRFAEQVLRSIVTFINGTRPAQFVNSSDWPAQRQVEQLRLQLTLLRAWRRRRGVGHGFFIDRRAADDHRGHAASSCSRSFIHTSRPSNRTGVLPEEAAAHTQGQGDRRGLYAANMLPTSAEPASIRSSWVCTRKNSDAPAISLHTAVSPAFEHLLACEGEQRERSLLPHRPW